MELISNFSKSISLDVMTSSAQEKKEGTGAETPCPSQGVETKSTIALSQQLTSMAVPSSYAALRVARCFFPRVELLALVCVLELNQGSLLLPKICR